MAFTLNVLKRDWYPDVKLLSSLGSNPILALKPPLVLILKKNVVRILEWDNMGVKIGGRQIHHLRFADDIVLTSPDISQAERMLADFDKACGKIGL
uniref:Reverse transcriptase domain-containing protein n=1 Tax=Angiostrongylus cantonensis TaxID=6313 RepID=A0A0K0D3P9_ANGCA